MPAQLHLFAIGMAFPLIGGKEAWTGFTFAYIFFASVLPMWLLKQPRDYMTTFMFAGMILGAVVGIVVAHPNMNLPMYTQVLQMRSLETCSRSFS